MIIIGGWGPTDRSEYYLARAQELLGTMATLDHLAPRTPDRPGAVVRIEFTSPHMAQKAVFQLGLAIDRFNATLPQQIATVWASLERPPSIQMDRRALLLAKGDVAALGIAKEELGAHHGDQSIHHGKYELVRVRTGNLVRGHDWEVHPTTAGRPWTDRPLRKS